MEGRRWKTLAAASALAATVGCRGFGQKQDLTSGATPPPAATAAAPADGRSAVARMFAAKPPGANSPKVTPETPMVRAEDLKKPLKAETKLAFTQAQVEAAFDLQEEGVPNPNLARMADDARGKYQKILEADPKNKEALQGLARLYTRLGDREHAVATMQLVLKHYPADHKSAYGLALTHARFEDWPNATACCQRALASDPENLSYKKTLGKLLARTGQLEQGFEYMATAMPEAEARYTMAKLLTDMERPELAKQQLQMAVKADPNFAPAQDWLASLNGRPPVQAAGYQEPSGN